MTDLSVDASISASAFRLFPDLKRFSVSALSHDRPLRHWTRLVAFSENFNDSFLAEKSGVPIYSFFISTLCLKLYALLTKARPGLVLGLRPDLNQKCTPEVN